MAALYEIRQIIEVCPLLGVTMVIVTPPVSSILHPGYLDAEFTFGGKKAGVIALSRMMVDKSTNSEEGRKHFDEIVKKAEEECRHREGGNNE